jgi:hypothetical protein
VDLKVNWMAKPVIQLQKAEFHQETENLTATGRGKAFTSKVKDFNLNDQPKDWTKTASRVVKKQNLHWSRNLF